MICNVKEVIEYLLDNISDPFPQYIMRKKVVGEPADVSLLSRIKESKWYKQLESEQLEDGSWGRFRSMDSGIKEKRVFSSTEAALRRAWDLLLEKGDPIVDESIGLMERYLRGTDIWRDTIEKHHDNGKSFCHAMKYICAANLSRFDPNNPLLTAPREVCAEQLEDAFFSGSYNDAVWQRANLDYSGSCLAPFMIYPLWLLQGTNCISDALQRRYLDYIWHRKDGIYYAINTAPSQKVYLEDKNFPSWLYALETLSGFSLFAEFAEASVFQHLTREIERLMTGKIQLPSALPVMGHYSESWRDKNARKNDLILRILRIIGSIK